MSAGSSLKIAAHTTPSRYNRSARILSQDDNMKRLNWILLLVAVASTLLTAQTKKMTVGQLQDVLTGLHNSQKSDEQVANELKQIELTEELTPAGMNTLVDLINGPLSTEQMYVLEARSAMLAPPDTDLPKAAAPDDAAQQAMLAKAQEYAAKTYPQLLDSPRRASSRASRMEWRPSSPLAVSTSRSKMIPTLSGTRSAAISAS